MSTQYYNKRLRKLATYQLLEWSCTTSVRPTNSHSSLASSSTILGEMFLLSEDLPYHRCAYIQLVFWHFLFLLSHCTLNILNGRFCKNFHWIKLFVLKENAYLYLVIVTEGLWCFVLKINNSNKISIVNMRQIVGIIHFCVYCLVVEAMLLVE